MPWGASTSVGRPLGREVLPTTENSGDALLPGRAGPQSDIAMVPRRPRDVKGLDTGQDGREKGLYPCWTCASDRAS